MYPHIDIDEWS